MSFFIYAYDRGWHKDVRSWLNYWGIMEDTKLRYYKDVVNHNLEDQNYLYVLTSVKKKISIAKIRTNSHELHSEGGFCPYTTSKGVMRVVVW